MGVLLAPVKALGPSLRKSGMVWAPRLGDIRLFRGPGYSKLHSFGPCTGPRGILRAWGALGGSLGLDRRGENALGWARYRTSIFCGTKDTEKLKSS